MANPRVFVLALWIVACSILTVPATGHAEPPARRPIFEIVLDDATDTLTFDAVRAAVTANGGELINSSPGVLLVSISVGQQRAIAEQILGIGHIREPLRLDIRPERSPATDGFPEFGPTAGSELGITNASTWHADGITGAGVKIGVIDYFDIPRYWDPHVAELGARPIAGVTARCFAFGGDCTNDFFDGLDPYFDEDHGVAVVEIVRDMAPDAQVLLGRATTVTDYYDLIDWFAANGVSIVTRSLGSRYDGPGDGRGDLDGVAAYANQRGILWVNSGGNNGVNHYYRQAVRLIGNNVAFGPTGNTTFLPFSNCIALGGIRWSHDWDQTPAQRTDYDVYVWESPAGIGLPVAGSGDDQRSGAPPIEQIVGTICPNAGKTLSLEIVWRGGDTADDIIEVLDYGDGIAALAQTAYSASTPIVDANRAGVISVGAIDGPNTGTIAGYSSQGPTNDERITPSVSAPSGFSSAVLNGTFSGTSAAAPVVAGGAALLLDADLASSPNSLGDLIRNSTVDRGSAGPDNAYGTGEFRLPAPPSGLAINQTPSRFVAATVPTRILDTRTESAIEPAGSGLIGMLWPGEILRVPVTGRSGVPDSNVTAVAVNITAVGSDRPSFVQALPTFRASIAEYSNLNTDAPGQTRANFAIVPVGDAGTISVYSIAGGNIVVDLLGWFEAGAGPVTGGRFVELPAAQRVLDTRYDEPIAPLQSGTSRSVRWPTGIDPSQVSALVVTVTGTVSSSPGWVQAIPSNRSDVIGTSSTINLAPGNNVANAAIVPVGPDGIAVAGFFAGNGRSDVVVDAIGYITSDAAPSAAGGLYVPVRPNRAFDSRLSTGDLADGQIVVVDGSNAPGVTIPSNATGVMWNVAAVVMNRPGFVRGWAADHPEPVTSSLNWSQIGEVRASAAITAVDAGRAAFRMEDGSANLAIPVGGMIVDVFGYFT